MSVERLVQQFAPDRATIFVLAAGAANCAGGRPAGSDLEAGAPSPDARDDTADDGAIAVTVEVADAALAASARDALAEIDAAGVVETNVEGRPDQADAART